MSRRSDEPTLVDPDSAPTAGHGGPRHDPGTHPEAGDHPDATPSGRRLWGPDARARLTALRRGVSAGVVRALPTVSRVFVAIGAVALLFVAFVLFFGAMRHTTRQEHLEEAFHTRVSWGRVDGPNWRPLPGQAIATISIPAIDLYEVVVHDTTPQLTEGGPGHLLGTPLPGHAGNSVVIGRRVTDGAPFAGLDELSAGDPITVVTPADVFRYEVVDVSRVPRDDESVLAATTDARLTLTTAGSSFVPNDRLVVAAALDGTPIVGAPVPQVELRAEQLGLAGDLSAIAPMMPWAIAFVVFVIAWIPIRRRISSRMTRFVAATPIVLVILLFLFENAEDVLPGSL